MSLLLTAFQYTVRAYAMATLFPHMDLDPLICITFRWGVTDSKTTVMLEDAMREQWRSSQNLVRLIDLHQHAAS